MDVVMRRSDAVVVMGEGRVLTVGTPDEVRRDPRVVEAYLGADDRRPARPNVRAMSDVLVVEGVEAGYFPDVPILNSVALAVAPGEMVTVVGPNGAGEVHARTRRHRASRPMGRVRSTPG